MKHLFAYIVTSIELTCVSDITKARLLDKSVQYLTLGMKTRSSTDCFFFPPQKTKHAVLYFKLSGVGKIKYTKRR